MKWLTTHGLLIFLAATLCGCSTNAPLRTLYYQAENPSRGKTMVIFLRGRGGSHEDFADEGFVDAVRERRLPVDMVAPNAHFGYYMGETLIPRLKEDVIGPARRDGYEQFWLVGVSMGGLGALLYAREHPDDVSGVCVISPFLGWSSILNEINEAGGIRSWEPGSYDSDKDWQRMLWHWLQQGAAGNQELPLLYLGYGTEDPYLKGQTLLATILPADRVFAIPGNHTAKTMKEVWLHFLDQGILDADR
ncbi:alpha/beta fold hydrolase [Desulfofustis glycolicus]|uniref:Pimeloyl-ACP methyl ester carboxylesterase n=1 Tax=Desulfofustis glycolicus DSM 9705 TaxID=1121409 RepID=A0A1M5SWG7_9BACT|nr:alpha/beta fold hydrolase [Desulfofustis glycolicus]MCB2215234.1 alpha/beta fold hydrolase [Desulfobulbaceae bacterium]SHH42846.1 Pimeloyl-ACP methyl ester carboxylesterase [Desulfofustis glycolicus DSM 9705]